MRRSPRPLTRRPLRSALLAAALLVVFAAGCGGQTVDTQGADLTDGKEKFVEKCGGCHVLGAAGTNGTVGPNLDNAFAASREQGFHESTFFEVILEQMKIPGNGSPMPVFGPDEKKDAANYLTDQQLINVAAYVASVAGTGEVADLSDPKALFTANCGSCHTLADAGTTGTTGPNLDDAKPALDAAITQITNGGGAMPAFEGQLTEEQIQALAEYLVSATGGR